MAVTITCQRKTETWASREEAMAFFFEGMIACMGSSEGDRYANIYAQLKSGMTVCSDEY